MTCGNGGSASDAMHLAEELIARFQKNRRALAAIALCDPTVVTCAANDFGYEKVFSRQVEALGNPGDVLIVFTTSGNSPNVLRALEAAKAQACVTAGFLGKDGGKAAAPAYTACAALASSGANCFTYSTTILAGATTSCISKDV
jgi:D-sedoheptulose 7-phosphate isomerase